jgi:hypothetical protein
MIDGAKRKRRNGIKGEARRLWYARWRAARFFQHFGLGQMAAVTVVSREYRPGVAVEFIAAAISFQRSNDLRPRSVIQPRNMAGWFG